MKLLVDTHTLLWWDGASSSMSAFAYEAIRDAGNQVLMSVVNAWELQFKVQLGKLTLTKPLIDIVHGQHRTNGFELIPVT